MTDAWFVLGALAPSPPWVFACGATGLAAALVRRRVGVSADLVLAAAAVMLLVEVAGVAFEVALWWAAPTLATAQLVAFGVPIALRVGATASMLLLAAAAVTGRAAR